jgi:hypothetical protein
MARKRTFAERMGAEDAPHLDLETISRGLQTRVWNLCLPWLFPPEPLAHESFMQMMRHLYREMGWPITDISFNPADARDFLASQFLNPRIQWTEFYQFAELIPSLRALARDARHDQRAACLAARSALNSALEQEGSPYRMAMDELAPITSAEEIEEVRAAAASVGRFELAAEHINQALAHLAQRPAPNYRDSIKQSFSAVESVLWVAIEDKPKLPQALRVFEARYGEIHGALRGIVEKLHGYASDEEGVRHAATEPSDVGEAEARLMLVCCSSMMNFLIRKVESAG